jgi:tetratricopeptide (TPR) repeat protein
MSDDVPLTFGEVLKRYRIAVGMTQEALAAEAGLSKRGVSDLERGARQAPRRDTVALLVTALKLAPEERAVFISAARRARARAVLRPGQDAVEVFDAPLMIGRTAEIGLLDGFLAGDLPPVFALAGEAGIGKTHLLREAARHAAAAGFAVLEGGCERHSGQEPYAPVLEALDRYLRGCRVPARRRAALQGCAWMARLLPELAETAGLSPPRWDLPSEQARRLMFSAVGRFLANVAGPSGTVLLLDDLHWASADALALLASILRSADASRLRVVLAYRSTEVWPDDPLALLLGDLIRNRRATRVVLGPLDEAAAHELLDRLLAEVTEGGEELRDRLFRCAGGVPLFLVSYAHAARSGALSTSVSGGPDAIPADIAETIRQQIALLPEGTRELLRATSVLGSVVERRTLVAVAHRLGRDKGEILAGLDIACRARILVEAGEDHYEFAHDLSRRVIADDLGLARRRELHQSIAETLEAAEGARRIEQLAYHYALGEDEEKALRYLEQAGDRARTLYAAADAADYYHEVVHRLDSLGRTIAAARAREKLAAVLMTRSRYTEALTALEQAAAIYEAEGEMGRLGEVTAQIGWAYALSGTPEAGCARLLSWLDSAAARDVPPSSMAALYGALAELYVVGGRYDEQLAAAERAAGYARRAQDARLLSQAEMCRGIAYLKLGRLDEAARVLDDALPSIETGGDLRDLSATLNNLALVHQARGELDQHARFSELAVSAARRLGDPALIACMLCNVAENRYLAGNWEEARAWYEQAVMLSESVGMSWAPIDPQVGLDLLSSMQGAGEVDISALEATSARAREHGAREAHGDAELALAEAAVLHGHAGEARARLTALAGTQEDGCGDDLATRALLRSALLAWALVEEGDTTGANALLDEAIERATSQRHRLALVDLLRVRAWAAIRAARTDEARTALDAALELAREMPYPYAGAKALSVYGRLHAAKGEPEQAREKYQAALAICARLGEGLYRPHVERALADLDLS